MKVKIVLNFVASVTMAISALFAIFGVIAFFGDKQSSMLSNAAIAAIGVSVFMVAGLLWLAIEISRRVEILQNRNTPAPEAPIAPSVKENP